LDKFKQVNDLHSHEAGDEVLQQVASVVRMLSEKKGQPYRYGGDEIVVLLPDHSTHEAASLAERIRQRVERLSFKRYPEAITVSIGIASYPEPTSELGKLLGDADAAMYAAKDFGGNAVHATGAQLNATTATSEGNVRLVRSDVASRVEAVELWMTLQQANNRSYGILLESDNDEDVIVEGISLRSGTLELVQTDMHGLLRQLRGFPVLRKQHHLTPLTARLVEHFDAPAPSRFLTVVDFPQVEYLPLHYPPRRTPSVLHDAPITMFLAILLAQRAAQEHAAIVHGPWRRSRG
jgi:diguanylate cyclase (GGDEF)-like protein